MMLIMLTLGVIAVLTLVYACLTAASNEDDRQDDYWIR